MKNIQLKSSIYTLVIVSAIAWFLLARLSDVDLSAATSFFSLIPKVVTIDLLIIMLFTKWGWKWKVFRGWLVPFPNLNGSWTGNIDSDWNNPKTGKGVPPIPVLLTVNQSFFHISCKMMTGEMDSFSVSEGLATPILPFTFIDRSTLTTDVTSLTSNVADFGSFYDLKTFTTCCTSLGDFDLSVGPDTIHNSFNSQITLGSGLSGIGRINLPVHNSFRVGNPIYAGNQNKIIVEMSGLYIDDLTSPLNAYGIRSILSAGVNSSFINHTGTARS